MDPISALIAVWLVAVFLTTRLPGLLTESRDGETTEEYAARLRRLSDAGIAPAVGSPLRQYVGNAWRDFLLDRQEKRRAKAGAGSSGPSWGSRQVDRVVDNWNRRHAADPDSADAPGQPPTGADEAGPEIPDGRADGGETPGANPPVDTAGDEPYETETVEDTATWGRHSLDEENPPIPETSNDPIRVESTVGDPVPDHPANTAQPQLEGADMTTTAVARGGEVTGVVSGANEARAIQRQVEAIRDAYNAALRQLGQRIVNLGEQAHANVELRTAAPVMNSIAQAAEACAAAIAHANSSAAEVSGALEVVKRGFNRLNS